MKKIFVFILILLFLPIVSAGVIKIGIKMELKGEISALFHNTSNGILKVNPEFFNTGSVAYKARIRLDIMNSTDIIFTGWSNEEKLMPGERKNYEIYWYDPKTENVNARVRAYFGNEMIERELKIKIENKQTPEDVFLIKNFRTYDDFIKFQVRSSKSLSNVIIIPKNYIMGWIFEQKKIESLDKNKNIEIIIPYKTDVWTSYEMSIDVVTEDGKYYSTFSFNLQKEKGFWKYVHQITDKLSLLFNL